MSLLRRAFPELRSVFPRAGSMFPSTRRASPIDSFFDDPFFNAVQTQGPALNVIENKNDFLVEVEVPGFSKDKLDLNVQDDTLTVSGSIESQPLDENSRAWNTERYSGSFSRSLSFPGYKLDPEKMSANLQNGILKISLQKEQTLGTKVEISGE